MTRYQDNLRIMGTAEDQVRYLTLQFLEWVAAVPHTYGEVIDAWRTSCPRLQVWEDATAQGYIRRGSGTLRDAPISITAKGKAVLKTAHIPPNAEPVRPTARHFTPKSRH
jgi:hypothetical protein